MKKNVQNQVVGAQLVSKTDGSAVTTGTTSVYVTGDNGTQTINSPGVATHKGNGYWEYSPDASETNYDHVAFTFVNSSAINTSIQIWTSFPQTGDNYARLGAPAGASVSADVAAVKAVLPAALVSGRIDASVGAYQSGMTPLQPTTAGRTLDVTATGEAGIDWSNIGAPTTTVNLSGTTISAVSGAVGSVTGAVGSVTGNVGGNVVGSVGSVSGLTPSDVTAIKTNTDKLGDLVEADSSPANYRLTQHALTNVWNIPRTAAAASGSFGEGVASVQGSVTGSVASVTGNVGGNVTGSVGSVVGAVGSVTGNVGGNVTGSVGSVASGGISAASFASGAIDANAIATDAIGSAELAASAVTEIAAGVRTELTAELASVGRIETVTDKLGDMTEADSSPANYRFTTQALANAPTGGSAPSASTIASAVRTELTPELAEIPLIKSVTDKVGDMVEADSSPANYRLTAHALAQAPTGGSAPTVTQIADEVQTRTIAAVTTVGSVSGNVGGNVVGSVGSIATGGIAAASFAAGAINSAAIATDAIDADALASDAVTEIQSGLSTLNAAGVRTAVGLASANLDTQLSNIATSESDITANINLVRFVTDALRDMLEADSSPANYRFTVHALANAPSASVNLADLLDAAIAGHTNPGTVGEKINDAAAAGNPWSTTIEGIYTAEDLLRIALGVIAGKLSITESGSDRQFVFRDVTDSTDIVSGRITSNGSRSQVTLSP